MAGEGTPEKKGVKRAAPDDETAEEQGSNSVENNADAPTSSSSPSSSAVTSSPLPSRATKMLKPNPTDEDEQTQPVTAAPAAVVDAVEREHTPVPAAEPGAACDTTTTTATVMSDSERVEAEALNVVGLSVGDRLEVMWILEEDGKSTEKASKGVLVFWKSRFSSAFAFI